MSAFAAKICSGLIAGAVLLGAIATTPARADKIANRVAVFAFLDKVTARISKKAVPLNQTVLFGSLKVTARACYSRPPTEEPKTTSFVEVDDQKLDGSVERIFSGWMLAQSPGLHAVEHPVYDVWLTDCDKPLGGPAQPVAQGQPPALKPAKASVRAPFNDAADPQALDPAAAEAQPGDTVPPPDALIVKKRHVKRQ